MPIPISNVEGFNISNKVTRGLPGNSSALTQSINIMVNGKVIGYIQNFAPEEGRNMARTWELGNEDVVELVPGGMSDNNIRVERVLLYYSRLIEVFDQTNGEQGNDVSPLQPYPVSIMDYNFPFDIYIYLKRFKDTARKSSGSKDEDAFENVLFEAYIGCWFVKYSYEIKADATFRLIEQATIQYTYKTGTSLLKKQG